MKLPELHSRRFSEAAAQGLRVFPLNVADGPPPVSWTDYEMREPTAGELATWDAGDCNVGIICGEPSDVVILVVDNSVSDEMLLRFPIPLTPQVRVGDERHFYFQKPAVEVGSSISIGPLRFVAYADCSTVVGAGSVRPDGCIYEWVVSLREVPLAPLPSEWIEDLMDEQYRTYGEGAVLGQLSEDTRGRVLDFVLRKCSRAISDLKFCPEKKLRQTFESWARGIRSDTAAIAGDWHAFAELLKGAALEVGLEPHATADYLAHLGQISAFEGGQPAAIAVRWVYDEQRQTFRRREELSVEDFNAKFGADFDDRDIAFFLLSHGLVDRISDCTKCDCR